MKNRVIMLAAVALAAACASSSAPDPRYPARAEGCEVAVYPDAPTVPADNLGSVRARCNDLTSEADCLRQLKDEVCRLGGDIVWGVPTKGDQEGDHRVLKGRAAHTHALQARP